MFFRELGFSLDDIQKLLKAHDFDKIKSLNAQRKALEEIIDRKKQLLSTIDKTINHLGGKQMSDQEFYVGFNLNSKKDHEQYIFHTDNQ